MKVIAAIDIMNGEVVRLTKGDQATKKVYSDDPVQIAKKWEKDGADMLHIVDLDAAFGSATNNLSIISEILQAVIFEFRLEVVFAILILLKGLLRWDFQEL
jgi:phosphoribosylformimino-5-aminoimidazole carboxamide ribotide isomerase